MEKVAVISIFIVLAASALVAGLEETAANKDSYADDIGGYDRRYVVINPNCKCTCDGYWYWGKCHCYACVNSYGYDAFRDECGNICEYGVDYFGYDGVTVTAPATEDYYTGTETREEYVPTVPPEPPEDLCRGFSLKTSTVSVMGHEPVIFQGDCFSVCGTTVTCTFNDPVKGPIHVAGRVEAPLFSPPRAICYAPYLYTLDPVEVDVTVQQGDGKVIVKRSSINIDRSSPFLALSHTSGASYFALKHEDMSKIALTSELAAVDIALVWYNPETRALEDLHVLQRDAKYITKQWFNVTLPTLTSLASKPAALASTFVTVAVRPSQLTNGMIHPFRHDGSAVFSAFYPAMYFDPALRTKYSSSVCKVWYTYTPKIKPPVDCAAKMSSLDGIVFAHKELAHYSAAASQASLGRHVPNTFETLAPMGQFGLGHECYYDASGNFLEGFRNAGGTADLVSVYKDEREHYFQDEVPWYACCSQDDTSTLCGQYYDARKSKR